MSSLASPRTIGGWRTLQRLGLRCWGAVAVVLLAMTLCTDSRADARVPMALQAQLAGRLASFDRNFQARAGGAAHVLVLYKAGNADSQAAAKTFANAVVDQKQIGGLKVVVDEAPLVDGPALAARCRANGISLVYFAVGLQQDIPAVARALVGVDVLTLGPSAQYATDGAVVAFDIEEARPKLIVNTRSAKAQNVSFKAELLKLARIVE